MIVILGSQHVGDIVRNATVGCYCFWPGVQFPSQPYGIITLRPVLLGDRGTQV